MGSISCQYLEMPKWDPSLYLEMPKWDPSLVSTLKMGPNAQMGSISCQYLEMPKWDPSLVSTLKCPNGIHLLSVP
ncbi:hypothetical protein CDAR_201361 [Caerostris darwini]|uniref:Uncharacterized protein n=1 Tax=Caerostris darwini TaxID=1538125 RepID=A0AAV4S2Q3_9ARAC|nr:hypothetical protein CDAR_201361 [Caerostris darwini]